MKAGSTWRLALRVARRDALRAKGRSALVVAMIALPIVGAVGADLAVRSGNLSVADKLERGIGQADASYELTGSDPIAQDFEGKWTTLDNGASSEEISADAPEVLWETPEELIALAEEVLPEGSSALFERTDWQRATTAHGVDDAEVVETDPGHPLAEGKRTLLDGEWPENDDEVVASSEFLSGSGLSLGDEVTVNAWGEPLDEGTTFTLVGEYEAPFELDVSELIVRPGAMNDTANGWAVGKLLVDVPGDTGVDWELTERANEAGFVVVSRELHLNPPSESVLAPEVLALDSGSGVDGTGVAVAVVAVSLVVLEVCLLAGPAFAVGARRSRRQLGLVGANGGERRQMRAIMLASGVVLGAMAAVIGLIGGIALVMLVKPLLEGQMGTRFGSWDFRWLELGGIAAFAVLIGLMAAVIPAYNAARTPVLASLTGRRGVRHSSRVLPLVGGCMLLFGTSLALLGGLLLGETIPVAAGAVIAELGLVACTPMLVGAFGRLARWLPLTPRLALRDAARNRGRTAPAVAAVLAAVAGTVAVATVTVSDEAKMRSEYQAQLPDGNAALMAYDADGATTLDQARTSAERELRVNERQDLAKAVPGPLNCETTDDGWSTWTYCGDVGPLPADGAECPAYTEDADAMAPEDRRAALTSPLCDGGGGIVGGISEPVLILEPEALALLGLDEPGAAEALAAGKALVAHEDLLDGPDDVRLGAFTKEAEEYDDLGLPVDAPDREVTLPAHVLEDGDDAPLVIITPEMATEAGFAPLDRGTVYDLDETPGESAQQAVDADIEMLGGNVTFRVEDGYKEKNSLALLVLALFATVITIGAAGIATGLAQADAAADLSTLSAVGATPRLRRALSGLQCGLIAAMGVLLGAVSGLIPAVGLRLVEHRADLDWWQPRWDAGETALPRPEMFIELPWMTFLQLIVVVPLVAWLLATLLTRSRVPLARRIG
ncbi:putative ABC transport system permease protein [Streptomyces zhaozhouensis]|uniref:Putative ABC transport system permease protein n=1 Tax=Streptomyces zhaozhouensis TaxID=1300267 RepID=A0A286DXH3_9ACTN|nr:ABC transporter permease [Streptomyces zhaozhouensis]SOD63254.1 putative ABC transport system permease protein [Streptomyces zhaozhouensis]